MFLWLQRLYNTQDLHNHRLNGFKSWVHYLVTSLVQICYNWSYLYKILKKTTWIRLCSLFDIEYSMLVFYSCFCCRLDPGKPMPAAGLIVVSSHKSGMTSGDFSFSLLTILAHLLHLIAFKFPYYYPWKMLFFQKNYLGI